MARKIRKVQLSTLIIIGEGIHEKAFLFHMKELYDSSNGQKTKIDSADGGSPGNIIATTIRKCRHAAYDKKYILLDSDVEITETDKKNANKNNIKLIVSTPVCLEGMLLDVLNKKVPASNHECKELLHPMLSGSPSRKESYRELFTKDVLDATVKEQIKILKKLIENKE